MPLGTEVGLGIGDVVLDGDPAPPKRGIAPSFRTMSIVSKRRAYRQAPSDLRYKITPHSEF